MFCQAIRPFKVHRLIHRSYSDSSTNLKDILLKKIPIERERITKFRKEHGKTKVGEVTVNMLYGGMRGILGLICETSVLDPEHGIRFRGLSIEDCRKQLPKAPGGVEPLPEGLFWLLVTGDVPNDAQVKALSKEWAERGKLPEFVNKLLKNLPKTVHPMAQLAAAVTVLSSSSHFAAILGKGVSKTRHWDPTYEDAMDLIGRITIIAAKIYRNVYKDGADIDGHLDPSKDWSHNFCKMLGYDNEEFRELMRMYLFVHSDHEGGNVTAHTTHLVSSAWSDCYLSLAAGLNGLAGPLHGLANQEVLHWTTALREQLGDTYNEEQIKKFVWDTLKAGKVVPGYGHAVLRKTDPRYVSFRDFSLRHLPDDPLFKLVSDLYKIVPPILQQLGKVQNPWPNVDAHSGVVLQYYGMKEMNFYTVLFGVSRTLGVLACTIWDRALGLPIERPKSISTDDLMKKVISK